MASDWSSRPFASALGLASRRGMAKAKSRLTGLGEEELNREAMDLNYISCAGRDGVLQSNAGPLQMSDFYPWPDKRCYARPLLCPSAS